MPEGRVASILIRPRLGCGGFGVLHHFVEHKVDGTEPGEHAQDLEYGYGSSQVDPLDVDVQGEYYTYKIDGSDDSVVYFYFFLHNDFPKVS